MESGQHVPEAAAAERSPARCQAGTLARVISPPLLHDVHCVFRPICIHWSWRRRCVLPSILGITLITWLAWLVWPSRSRRIAWVWARRTTRLLCIGWVRGSWTRARVRWRIFVVHVGCRICPYSDNQVEPSAHTGLVAKVKAPKAKSTFFFFSFQIELNMNLG